MSDLTAFARDTELRVACRTFEDVVRRYRRRRRRRAALAATALVAVATTVLGAVASGRLSAKHPAAEPTSQSTAVSAPGWTADEVVGHPDAFVVQQQEARTDRRTVLTVWRRCVEPAAGPDCAGREAMAVVDGSGRRLLVLGAITGVHGPASPEDRGTIREVSEGTWYWAHHDPGPYLMAPDMRQPLQITVMDRPVAPRYGTPTVECTDGVGLCALDTRARTLERLEMPDLPDVRWATPNQTGCGIWGLAGAGGDLRLIIQQPDGSFGATDIAEAAGGTSMAEGGASCEVAIFQAGASSNELLVSLDSGSTWQVRGPVPAPRQAGLVEEYPRLRVLLPARWPALPAGRSTYPLPGPISPL